MKVLHLISGADRGGAMTHVLSLLGELNNGPDVRLLCLGDGPLARRAAEMGLPHTVLPRRFSAGLAGVRGAAKESGAEVLHCHGSRANLTGALLKRELGIPVISTVHSDHTLDYLGRPMARLTYGALNARALRRMDALVCVSEAMAETYRGRGFPNVYAIRNGADFAAPRREIPREERSAVLGLPVSAEDILVGAAARLDPVKDLPTLLRGFAGCRTAVPLKLVIAGTGPEEKKLRSLAETLAVSDRVFFPGWVEDMESFYACLDVAALTSRSETSPYALTMAARYGLPVIATAVGGVPELVEDGANGRLISPGDAEAFSRALADLAKDEALRRRMGAALRDRGERDFSLTAMGERQREIYRDILQNRG
ncbi:MAG: glycosyltransferase family 4 protein [Oscillospiraceae bacterium]|nr:glycosyltransferase family 4 protein [Oscillospiraceae bacterium]